VVGRVDEQVGAEHLCHVRLACHDEGVGARVEACGRSVDEQPDGFEARVQRGQGVVGAEGQGLLALWPITNIERLLTAALAIGNARVTLWSVAL
jgi:hypothetical protein